MKLTFIVTGFGYGDSIRTSALIEALKKRNKNLKIQIFGYENSYNFFNKNYPTYRIRSYKFADFGMRFWTTIFAVQNVHLPLLLLRNLQTYKNEVEKFDPEVIISDFEPLANMLANALNIPCITIFGYDPKRYQAYRKKSTTLNIQAHYIERLYRSSQTVIIPSFLKQKDYDNIKYVSPIIREWTHKQKKRKQHIVMMLGGSDFGLKLAKQIKKLSIDEEIMFFGGSKTIGKGHQTKFDYDFLNTLTDAKGVITLAGNLTISECLFFKKPMLIFPIKNHIEQLLNAKAVERYAMIGKQKHIKESVYEFLEQIKKPWPVHKHLKFDGATQAARIIEKVKKSEG